MPGDASPISSFAFSGWTTTWPTSLLAIIWLIWLASWVGASFWSGQTRKHVTVIKTSRYHALIVLGGILFTPWTSRILGETPFWNPGETGVYVLTVVTLAGIAVGTVSAVLGAILISLGMAWKAKMEEVFLAQELGPDYVAYRQRVPMIIPFLPPG